MNKLLSSSANPEKLSLTVKGIMVGVIPVILVIAGIFNLNVSEGDLTSMANALVGAITAIGVAASAVITLYGLVRKIVIGLKSTGKIAKPE